MNENINLCKLLKGHEGEIFYCSLARKVILQEVTNNNTYPIKVISILGTCMGFTKEGRYFNGENGECLLFPSEDQRDWNKWAKEQKSKVPKTWSKLVKQDKFKDILIRAGVNNVPKSEQVYLEVTAFDLPIEKSALALLKIHQLIEVGYGGNVNSVDEDFYTICYNTIKGIFVASPCFANEGLFCELIRFHTKEQAEEFLSYPENVQLIKDFYMI